MTQDIFVPSVLVDKVKIKPHQISSNMKDVLQWILESKFEGKCSYHGFIKPKSIKVHSYSMGKVFDMSLNGDVEYVIQYHADICNPAIGSIIPAIVTNKNNFGILAESFIDFAEPSKKANEMKTKNHNKRGRSILEIIIVKSHHIEKDIKFDKIKENDWVNVEILGKKFELNDKKLSAWGRIVKSSKNTLLDHIEIADENPNDQAENGDDDKDLQLGSDELSEDEQEQEQDQEQEDDEKEGGDDELVSKRKMAKIIPRKNMDEFDDENDISEEEADDGEDLDDDDLDEKSGDLDDTED